MNGWSYSEECYASAIRIPRSRPWNLADRGSNRNAPTHLFSRDVVTRSRKGSRHGFLHDWKVLMKY